MRRTADLLWLLLPLLLASFRVPSASAAPIQAAQTSQDSPVSSDDETSTLPGLSAGATCTPDWLPTFGGSGGLDAPAYALAVFDDGTGPALYAGGNFSVAGASTAPKVARWDGETWSNLSSEFIDGEVYCLAVFDDGSGPALYAGGKFTEIGATPHARIAKWDGSAWSAVGSGLGSQAFDEVRTLTVHDEGTGPALYAGGFFAFAGQTAVSNLARWDGTTWSAVGGGANYWVEALVSFDDGSGPALVAAGSFNAAGGSNANFVARWDGSAWSPLGIGMNQVVRTLAVHDDGTGQALYAGGEFDTAGFGPASRIARWDGAAWSALGSGMDGSGNVHALLSFDDGSGGGPALYAGGTFLSAGGASVTRIARWDGQSWSAAGLGLNHQVHALAAFDSGGGPAIFAAGGFTVARHQWGFWHTVTSSAGLSDEVLALASIDVGSGSALYLGGRFTTSEGQVLNHIARWDGLTLSPLGSGLNSTVRALAVFDDGNGPALYAGGNFTEAGGVSALRIAKWDGSNWSPLGAGMNHLGNSVTALAVYDDGSGGGPALYAGGNFYVAGGADAHFIARWDGNSWSELGAGLDNQVHALAVFDGGSGPELFVGGDFSEAGGATAFGLARWDGQGWSTVAAFGAFYIHALTVHDDGQGPALYAGGTFNSFGSNNIRRWDGQAWSGVGGGTHAGLRVLSAYDDGSGPALYAGLNSGVVQRWQGGGWTSVPNGPGALRALAVHDDGQGSGPVLWAGGIFPHSSTGDAYLTRYGGCAAPVGTAYCFGDGSGSACPCGNVGAPGMGCANSAGSGATLSGQGSAGVGADDLGLAAHDLIPGQPALLYVGNNAVQGGAGVPFGDGLRCAGGGVRRLAVRTPDAAGSANWGPGLAADGGWAQGNTRRFQVWYRDPLGSPCGANFNYTNAFEVTFGP